MNESTKQQRAYCTPNRMLQCGNGNDIENKGKKWKNMQTTNYSVLVKAHGTTKLRN